MSVVGQKYIQAGLRRLGSVPVQIGSDVTQGKVTDMTVGLLAGQNQDVVIQANSKQVLIETGTLPGLAQGATMVIASLNYNVYSIDVLRNDMTHVYCARKP